MIAGLMSFALALQAGVLYAFLAKESLEQADRWVDHALEIVRRQRAVHGRTDSGVQELELAQILSDLDLAVRVVDERGEVRATLGTWPNAGHTIPVASRRNAFTFPLFRADRYVTGAAMVSQDAVVHVAVSLSPFARELDEVERALVLIVLLSGLGALTIGIASTSMAFAPLRQTTQILRGLEAGARGARIVTRGTGDAVDQHAEVLNRVLIEIDASFSRLRQFSSDVAHEFRTPLNRIRNVSEIALMDGSESELRAAMHGVKRTAEGLSEVVQTLLLVAEIDDGSLALRAGPLDIDRWIGDLVETYFPVFEERGVTLRATCNVGIISADRGLLDRLVINLLENALQHTTAGDTVEIGGIREREQARVWVDDSGPGVPEDQRERIFDRFVRAEPHRGDGTGLGLALARSIVRLHRGEITVEQSALGGARFVFWVPATITW